MNNFAKEESCYEIRLLMGRSTKLVIYFVAIFALIVVLLNNKERHL